MLDEYTIDTINSATINIASSIYITETTSSDIENVNTTDDMVHTTLPVLNEISDNYISENANNGNSTMTSTQQITQATECIALGSIPNLYSYNMFYIEICKLIVTHINRYLILIKYGLINVLYRI